ncbi:hypothetical protein EV193_104348 [Herbihabitans rhizosphaerae]|uniref:Uncharacterized protein n=1 Tax=Herbihabitans rhizosphaerae TaxID=1872711 RepID=A0A4Q7KUH4_9PSEU|nr:hypothetical protein [Herbihabitans rhizosphaerae]RZS39132.1 hypothetical protein EV193_104348 [Herbihabitans rhizosphaerae]
MAAVLEIAWPALLVLFAVAEYAGYLEGLTFTRWIRRGLGISPARWWRWITIPATWAFCLWLPIHLTTRFL